MIGIIGSNGSGKSTLLKILSRITEPTSGEVKLHGRVSSLLEVGTGFHPELTGRENIYLNSAILGMRKTEIESKFDEIVDFAEIEKFIDTPVKRYSSGMYVRLAFAVAAHLEPEILLVDEVLAVGDAQFQKKCLGKMGDVAKQGRTVLFVSHNMAAIKTLCPLCLALRDGNLYQNGNTEDVISSYIADTLPTKSLFKDLSSITRRSNVGIKLKILHVQIHSKDGILKYRDPIEINLKSKALNYVDDVVFGIGINTIEGTRLITVESEDCLKLSLKKNQELSIKVTIPITSLPPSTYILAVGAKSGGNLSIDSIPDALIFEIMPKANALLIAQRSNLGLRPDSEWSIT